MSPSGWWERGGENTARLHGRRNWRCASGRGLAAPFVLWLVVGGWWLVVSDSWLVIRGWWSEKTQLNNPFLF